MIDVFVLGVERSGTTWVSNILEAHPNTCVYMEPLSSSVSGFKSWPGRFTKLEDTDLYAQYFQDEFASLKHRRRFLFTRYFDGRLAWDVDDTLANLIKYYIKIDSARDFQELNFHRVNDHFNFPSKNGKLTILKEVRINYKAEIIKRINPNAKVIVPIRGYGPVVESIDKCFRKGSLVDLKKDMKNKCSKKITKKCIFEYWYSSYNSLLKKLAKEKVKYRVFNHKKVLEDRSAAERIVEWLGLSKSTTVEEYLLQSAKRGSGKHNTRRDPSSLLERAKRSNDRFKSTHSFIEEYPKADTHPDLEPFFR